MRLSLLDMTRVIAFLLVLFLCQTSMMAQRDFSIHGSLKVANYTQKVYKANPQIFSISQSKEGVMFFANQRGVLEYDGETWKTHELPNKAESFNLINSPRFLVVSTSGLGEFVINDVGEFVYESRNEHLPQNKEFYNVLEYKGQFIVSNFDGFYVLNEDFEIINQYINKDGSIGDISAAGDFLYFLGENNDIVRYDGESFEVYLKTRLNWTILWSPFLISMANIF